MMFEAGCIEIFSKNMAFDKLFPVCSISWLFNSAVLITLKPQLIQVGSNLMFLHWWPYACAGLKLEWKPSWKPHISHKKCFCQWFVPFERRVTQCSNVWQNEARNKGFHLKHTQRAWVLVSELTYIHMGFSPPLYFSPLWKSSWVFKAVVLVKYFSQHLQCLHW